MATTWSDEATQPAAAGGGFVLDFEASGFLEDPYSVYHALRAHDPVFLSPWGDWYLSRYADVAFALSDRRFSRKPPHGANPISGDIREALSFDRMLARWMLYADPPRHTKLRQLAGKTFTAKFVQSMRPRIQARIDRLLDRVAGQPVIDVVDDLAYPLPLAVISRMLGVPEADYEDLKNWSVSLTRGVDTGRLAELQQGTQAVDEISAYVRGHIEARKSTPQDDLISSMVSAASGHEWLVEDDLIANIVLLIWAGHETTKNLICNAVVALLRNPDQLALLTREPGLMPSAVDEFLRFDSPVQRIVRWTREDMVLGEHKVPAGQSVVCLLAAANRDPEQFPQPDRLDIQRKGGPNLGFGRGLHHCLGFAIARLEAEIALTSLLARTKQWALAAERVVWQPTSSIRAPQHLPLAVEWIEQT